MGKIFYHNITKGVVNENDLGDFMDQYEDGDLIYKTEAGCALLEEVSGRDIRIMKHQRDGNEDTSKCNCSFPKFTYDSPMRCENCDGTD